MPEKRPEETDVPPTILPAITTILTIMITAFAARFNFDLSAQNVALLSAAAALLIVEYLKYRSSKATTEKVEKVEAMVPGITTSGGPIAEETIIKNDPSSPLPPIVTTIPSKGSP